MPKKPTKKKGNDGLTDRERAFAAERRKDPAVPSWQIAQRAGYEGPQPQLTKTANRLLKKSAVLACIFAPITKTEQRELSDSELKSHIQRRLKAIMDNDRATDSDKIKAADKLLATLVGGYVPIQVRQEGAFTLESWVRSMGGAPEEPQDSHTLPEVKQ